MLYLTMQTSTREKRDPARNRGMGCMDIARKTHETVVSRDFYELGGPGVWVLV